MVDNVSQNQKLADYIKKNLSKGYTLESLKYSLMQQGYSRTSVEKAIEIANKQLALDSPRASTKPVIKYEIINDDDMASRIAAQDSGDGFFKRMWRKIFK